MKKTGPSFLAPYLEAPDRLLTEKNPDVLRAVAVGFARLLVKRFDQSQRPKKKRAQKPELPRITGKVSFPVFRTAFGLKLGRGGNDRGLLHQKIRKVSAERRATRYALGVCPAQVPFPVVVVITRCAPGYLDTDNLTASAKAVRDEVAAWLGVDDGVAERDGRVTWLVEQRRGPRGVYHVEVEVKGVTNGTKVL